jgi:hypothetical protein
MVTQKARSTDAVGSDQMVGNPETVDPRVTTMCFSHCLGSGSAASGITRFQALYSDTFWHANSLSDIPPFISNLETYLRSGAGRNSSKKFSREVIWTFALSSAVAFSPRE